MRGRFAYLSVAAAVALGACGACRETRAREPLVSSAAAQVPPRWRVVMTAPRPALAMPGRADIVFDDGSLLSVDRYRGEFSRLDATGKRWHIDWSFDVEITDVATTGTDVWVLVHSRFGPGAVIAGTTIANGPDGSVAAALVRIDAATGTATRAQVLPGSPDLALPSQLAVGGDAIAAYDSGADGGLWRIDPKTLATTAMARNSFDLSFDSIDVVSPGLTCAHISDRDEYQAAYVCFDAALREHSRVRLPSRPQHLWTDSGTVAGTVTGGPALELDVDIELTGLPPLRISAVCRVAEERGLWDWLALYDKDGTEPPVVERCVDTRVHASSVGTAGDGTRLLTVWAMSSIRVVDRVIEIAGSTTVLLRIRPDLTVEASAFPSCSGSRIFVGRWLVLGCDSPSVVDLSK